MRHDFGRFKENLRRTLIANYESSLRLKNQPNRETPSLLGHLGRAQGNIQCRVAQGIDKRRSIQL